MKNLLLSSIFFVMSFLLTSCGADSVADSVRRIVPIKPLPTLSVEAGTGGEEVGSITFIVSLSEISAEAVTFKYRTEIVTGNTAQQADFTAIGALGSEMDGTISIGEISTTIEVTVDNDTKDDDDETFSLVLSNVNGAFFAGGRTTLTAIGTITDDDLALPTLRVRSGRGGEGVGSVTFIVGLSEIPTEAVTFKYRTEIGTGYTAQQADFTAIGALGSEADGMITVGNTALDIVVVITEDTKDDDDETFSLVLSDVSGAIFAGRGTTLTAIGTITDDDLPISALSVGAGIGGEGGSVTFNVSLNRTVLSDVTFKYRTGIVTGNTADQADFTAIGAVGTEMNGMIAAGSTALDVVVVTTDNTSKEGDKTFSLVLRDVSGVLFSPAGTTLTATGTISDNDVADSNGNGLLDIASVTELDNIRHNLAGTSYKTAGNDTGDSSYCPAGGCNGYELIYDIDLVSFTNWSPIQGQANTSITTSDACVDDNSGIWNGTGCILPAAFFSAIFDGNGKTISNLTISRSTNILGLFGVVDGTLKNLKLRDGSITGLSTSNSTTAGALAGHLISSGIIEASSSNLAVSMVNASEFNYVGGLVGYNDGTIQNSNATGVITSGEGNEDYAGGLVGYNDGGTVRKSYATGAVTGGDSVDHLGGLVGWNGVGTVQNSYATGAVTGGAGIVDYVGGLVGSNDGTIQNSYATGTTNGGNGRDYVGGLVGYNGENIIKDSYATGAVKGGAYLDYVGGLAGVNGGTIQDSYAIGAVTGEVGGDRVGGLVGENSGPIQGSYATGVVTGGVGNDFVGGLTGLSIGDRSIILNSYARGKAVGGVGKDYVGGLVGFSSGTIQNSNAMGAVTGDAGSGDIVGGLVGWSRQYAAIRNSYATGTVTDSYGDINELGGLVGSNNGGTIQNSYATGAVTGGAGSGDFVGGLAGRSYEYRYDSLMEIKIITSVIRNSYTTSAVTGSAGGDNKLGGLVGSNSGSTIQNSYAIGAVTGGAGSRDFVGGLVGRSNERSSIRNNYALGAVIGGAGNGDNAGRIVGSVDGSTDIFGNYYIGANTLEGEIKRVIGTDEAVEKTVAQLKELTAATTETDFTSTDATDGWITDNWDFTADKYPSLKSFKTNGNDEQIESVLLCGQGADWAQC